MDKMLWVGEVQQENNELDIIAVDGKESRGSKREPINGEATVALRTLNVYSTSYRMCLSQKFIGEKTNEIPAAQEILKHFNLKGDIVTADAMNCQKCTVRVLTEARGNYVLALKGNQKLFYEEAALFFDEELQLEIKEAKGNMYNKTIEPDHGCIVIREYYISENIPSALQFPVSVTINTSYFQMLFVHPIRLCRSGCRQNGVNSILM